jgi:hypothetical protein
VTDVDLVQLIAANGWPPEQAARLRSMCSVAATRASLPEDDRALAAAIVAALDGRAAGITREQLDVLLRSELLEQAPGRPQAPGNPS